MSVPPEEEYLIKYSSGMLLQADQCVVQNLTWLGVYLRSTLSNTILQKVLTLVPLIVTGPRVFVATMTKFLSDSFDDL